MSLKFPSVGNQYCGGSSWYGGSPALQEARFSRSTSQACSDKYAEEVEELCTLLMHWMEQVTKTRI